MSTYNYRSLPPGCIRLLRLSPHEDDDAPIQCQLFEYSLASARRKGTHLYEALSYFWGSPTKIQTVITDAGLLHITENLHAALLRLRDPALERIIWADAICINQDDLNEKGQQIQLMAEIYARASCVIVWLESVTGDHLIDGESETRGRQAMRALEAAASRSTEAPSIGEQDRLAVEELLGRPWFRRVWVIQEVAAARHILIMCKFAEIDGQAFCSALDRMSGNLLLEDEDARSRIRSIYNLVKGATLRPKGVVISLGQFSLQISALGHLIEMHFIREATDRRDKIYALLGMSTDKPTGLVPNYQMSWKDLFPHVVKSLFPEALSVTTTDGHETVFIRIQGCVIGTVEEVENKDSWYGQQLVTVIAHRSDPLDEDGYYSPGRPCCIWTLQATSKRIHQGDVVCLLQGTSLPVIVRAHEDYCSIITIAVDRDVDITTITDFSRNNRKFEFLLTWCWKAETYSSYLNDFLAAQSPSPVTCITWQIRDDLNTAVMLLETKQYYSAMMKTHSIMLASDDVSKSEHPDTMAAARFINVVQKVLLWSFPHEIDHMLRNLIGRKRGYINVTEDILIQLASVSSWEPMAFVLDTQGSPITITENVLAVASENKGSCGKSIIEVLLNRREDQISITEKCLKAAMTSHYMLDCMEIIELFLNNKVIRISPTENYLIELAGDAYWNNFDNFRMLEMLLDERKGDQIAITENVLVAAAACESHDLNHMMSLLLERKKNQITITEDVLIAVAANEKNGDFTMSTIQREIGYLTVTEKVLAAAATNKKLRSIILGDLFSRKRNQRPVTNQVLKTVYQNLSDNEGRTALQLEMNKRGIC